MSSKNGATQPPVDPSGKARAKGPQNQETHVHKKPRLSSDMLDSIVIIKVGSEKKPFYLHKGLLCQSSPYFRAALEGGFKEAELQTIEWLEEDPTIVDMFKIWLYSETVNIEAVNSMMAWEKVVDLYIFAEVYGLDVLQNGVIDAITEKLMRGEKIDIPVFDKLYSKTPAHAPLRKLAVDLAIQRFLDEGSLPEKLESFSKGLLVDVVIAKYDKAKIGKHTAKYIRANRSEYYSKAA